MASCCFLEHIKPDSRGAIYRTKVSTTPSYRCEARLTVPPYGAYIVARERGKTPDEAAKDAALQTEGALHSAHT